MGQALTRDTDVIRITTDYVNNENLSGNVDNNVFEISGRDISFRNNGSVITSEGSDASQNGKNGIYVDMNAYVIKLENFGILAGDDPQISNRRYGIYNKGCIGTLVNGQSFTPYGIFTYYGNLPKRYIIQIYSLTDYGVFYYTAPNSESCFDNLHVDINMPSILLDQPGTYTFYYVIISNNTRYTPDKLPKGKSINYTWELVYSTIGEIPPGYGVYDLVVTVTPRPVTKILITVGVSTLLGALGIKMYKKITDETSRRKKKNKYITYSNYCSLKKD